MKAKTLVLILALFSTIALAQMFSGATNCLTATQAVRVASGLQFGMDEEDADRFLESHGISALVVGTNGTVFVYRQRVGDCFVWDTPYPLRDVCELRLVYTATGNGTNWAKHGLLQKASIQSNRVDILPVKFTKGP